MTRDEVVTLYATKEHVENEEYKLFNRAVAISKKLEWTNGDFCHERNISHNGSSLEGDTINFWNRDYGDGHYDYDFSINLDWLDMDDEQLVHVKDSLKKGREIAEDLEKKRDLKQRIKEAENELIYLKKRLEE